MSQENNKQFYLILVLAIALALMAAALYAESQRTAQQNTENTIFMSGYAEQKVVPDTASISIGVVTQAKTANGSSNENAAIMNAVVNELKAIGLEDKEMQTSYVSVSPIYNYTGGRTITGYSAYNSVEITTQKLDMINEIIDRSAAAGANQIGSLSFSVSGAMQKQLRDELISEAVNDSRSKADTLASTLNVKITGVKTSSVNDNSGVSAIYSIAQEMPVAEGTSTPISPGESTVSMTVQVTYIIK
ncbi:SIMPL domain-containing protein [Methanolobus sediminis]|uniref:SIMPL domain-containing protein n=1 Tax=Methanolobus sediminis TaxID=3072978 RepID=A0AA51YLL7_9EURY|nr:SIMPL domain-containing protein [Methanolobus sediminis]WMW25109.1 SIMPL domain-containing protein [Methanolobus sediminis]